MNAKVLSDPSAEPAFTAPDSVDNGQDSDSLDFTIRPIGGTPAMAAENRTETLEGFDYREWGPWLEGFEKETESLPWAGQAFTAILSEYVKASVTGDAWRPDVVHPLKRAYERYSESLRTNGVDSIGKSDFVELFAKELRTIPAKLYRTYLNKRELEIRARDFNRTLLANPRNAEVRKLRDLAETLVLSRSKFSRETSEKDPENPCVKLQLAIKELSAKIERSVPKPAEASILTTPVSELVSRALSGFGLGKKEKKQ